MPVNLPWDSESKVLKDSGKYIREKSDDLYHTARWARLSAMWRDRHPVCVNCERRGYTVPATCTDHIVPFPICRDFFFEESNLQSLCDECNHLKGQSDKAFIARWQKSTETQRVVMTLQQLKKIFK